MARMTADRSELVEEIEGDLGMLGSSLVYLRLVAERIQAAMAVTQQLSVLAPAVDDLRQASSLIRRVQQRASNRLASSPPAQFSLESSSEKTHKVHQTVLCKGVRLEKGVRP
ncbi:MAG: hypothetical protein ACYC36_00175 [Bellilinea sp.]